jgi:hypothetical protein
LDEVVTVDCDMRKWGDVQHWRFAVELLGRDVHGTWLGARPPTKYSGPRGEGEFTYPFVVLVPEDQWWIATYYEPGPDLDVEIYVDITTPSTWLSDTHITTVDLDLDVVLQFDGTLYLDDQDEFDEHKVVFGYPQDVIDTAQATARDLMDAVRDRREPFGIAGKSWLDRV